MSQTEPAMWEESWNSIVRSHRLFDQKFGHVVRAADVLFPRKDAGSDASEFPGVTSPSSRNMTTNLQLYKKPTTPRQNSGISEISFDGRFFRIQTDVDPFEPSQLVVKVLEDDRVIIVNGRHPERVEDSGYISRTFTRRYFVPKKVDLGRVSCKHCADGTLLIEAPALHAGTKAGRIIPIQLEKDETGRF